MSEHAEVMVSPLQLMLPRKKESLLNRIHSFILIFKFRKNQKERKKKKLGIAYVAGKHIE